MISPRIADAVIVTVTVVFVINFAVSILVPSYRADPQINVIFLGVVGGSLALRRKPRTPDDPGGEP